MPFPALGIKARLNAILLTIFCVAFLLDFGILTPAVFSAIRTNARDRQASLVDGLVENLEAEFQRGIRETEEMALLPELRSLDRERMDATIIVANASNAFFDYFFVTDRNGKFLSYPTQPQLFGKGILPENMGWVRAVIEGNRSHVLDAHKSQLGTIVTGVASPIRGEGGQPIGLVRGVMTLGSQDSIFSLIRGVKTGPGSLCALMDRNGDFLATSWKERIDGNGSMALPPLERLREASGGADRSFVVKHDRRTWLATLATVPSSGWTVAVGQPLSAVLINAWRLSLGSAGLFLGAILLSLLAIRYPIGRSLASLGALLSAMRGGRAPATRDIKGSDEIGALAREIGRLYTDLADSKKSALESEARVARLKRFEDLGVLAAGIAHNYRNILQGIGASADLLTLELKDCPPSSARRLADISSMVAQGSELATALMRLGKGQASERSALDLRALVFDLAEMFGHAHPGIRMDLRAEDGAYSVVADRGSLQQVFLNLFMNAAQAMEQKGRIMLSLAPSARPQDLAGEASGGAAWVSVRIVDEGPGMDEETQAHLFEPFFTRKEGGTGLGLSSAFRIVQTHGGYMACESEPGKGASFTVWLPLAAEPKTGS